MPRSARPVLASFTTLLLACGPSTHRPAPRSTAPQHPPRVASLVSEIQGHRFPSPLLRVEVNGHPTLMIVDTGASYHVLGAWFAREIGLATAASAEHGSEHAGRSVDVRQAEHVTLRAGDGLAGAVDRTVPVLELPPVFQALQIGGIISPQFFASADEAVVLDLAGGVMRVVARDEVGAAAGGGGRALGAGAFTFCETREEFPWQRFTVATTVDGEPAQLEIDTGAGQSDIEVSSSAGARLAHRAETGSDAGATLGVGGAFTTRTVTGVAIRVGEVETTRDVDVVPADPSPNCARDGVLGMDVLHDCTLVLQGRASFGFCRRQP